MKLVSLLAALLLSTSVGFADMAVKPLNIKKAVATQNTESTSSSESEMASHGVLIFVGPMIEHNLPQYQGWEDIDLGMFYATALDVPTTVSRLKEYMAGQCKNRLTSLAAEYESYGSVLDHFNIERMSQNQYTIAYGNLHCFGKRK